LGKILATGSGPARIATLAGIKSMKEFHRTVFVIVSLFVISSCSSKGELRVQHSLDTRIDHAAVASLSVQPDERVKKTEAVLEAVRRLHGQPEFGGIFYCKRRIRLTPVVLGKRHG